MAFELTSPAFENRREIPVRHERPGANLSPFLQWHDPPNGTQSYVLIMEDADAPTPAFRHWAVHDIPAGRRQLTEGMSSKATAEDLRHAYNDFSNLHYDGPDPSDGVHTYRFRLAALPVTSLAFPLKPML
ncbi:YbhB/YbcL family Raf kinase inhibitor-like protein (plasmid) [Rhizobium sullae]|uniref:YbhB/YbcL family Raf kinase inhibitor-like protein n=1 Tax=Rhizobium sullae TaxID=50338 RepID=A0A2N0D826_RHISU|nr:YbhB/YbcL family Raf kinase inhibitor-like protein [Rhizobium sullae]PKA42236.1 YbhB/YbcL family Raf kinase inhibitor-like protein [Rhizobium sullae]UWU18260.1 YbhB/YbcL family Raf kinase inhibitor-like protein [Rhizobium sullae]